MSNARKLYLFSSSATGISSLESFSSALSFNKEAVYNFEELKGKLEGGQVQYLLLDGHSMGAHFLRSLGEPDPQSLLTLSLAELEKRHILRVLASTNGNKTRAAGILGIDTKTLYNKLKSYQVSERTRARKNEPLGQAARA